MFRIRLGDLFKPSETSSQDHALRIDFARPLVYPELEGLMMHLQENMGGEIQMVPEEYRKTFSSPFNTEPGKTYHPNVKIRTRLVRGTVCTDRGDFIYHVIDRESEQQVLFTAMLLSKSPFDVYSGADTSRELREQCRSYTENYIASLPLRDSHQKI